MNNTVTPAYRPRPPKSFPSKFWGSLRAFFGLFDRRPRWLWSWLWNREFDALLRDADRRAPLPSPPPGGASDV